MIKIAILGGTFDPIHMGHLVIAEEILEKFNLDHIFLLPAGNPYFKTAKQEVSAVRQRLAMTDLGARYNSKFIVSRVETENSEPSYTADTLKKFKTSLPDSELYFIIGSDILHDLPKWHKIDELVTLCNIIVILREKFTRLNDLPQNITEKLIFASLTAPEIRSVKIRELVSQNKSITGLVTPEVEKYILENKLYRRN